MARPSFRTAPRGPPRGPRALLSPPRTVRAAPPIVGSRASILTRPWPTPPLRRRWRTPLPRRLRLIGLADTKGMMRAAHGRARLPPRAPEWTAAGGARAARHRSRDQEPRPQGRRPSYLPPRATCPTGNTTPSTGTNSSTSSIRLRDRPLDVLVDRLEMCHSFEFAIGSRSTAHTPAGRAAAVQAPGRQDQPQGRPRRADPPRRASADLRRQRHQHGPDHRAHIGRLGLVADRDGQSRPARCVPRGRAWPGDLETGRPHGTRSPGSWAP